MLLIVLQKEKKEKKRRRNRELADNITHAISVMKATD